MAAKRLRPNGDEELWPGTDYPHTTGYADTQHYPWPLDEDYAEQLHAEIEEKLKRRRPIGFQAVWEDD